MKINPALIENKVTDVFKIKKYSKSITVSANGMTTVNMGTLSVPSGYTFVGILSYENGYGDQWVVSYCRYSGNVQATVHSKYNASLTNSLTCYVLYIKTDVYNTILTT